MSTQPVRVLIVDDHTIVRKGISALLSHAGDIEVVGEASNGQEAIDQALLLQPDLVLMDLVMPGIDGIEAIRCIAAHCPTIRILVLTSFSTDDKVFPAIKAGALGYLLKDSRPEELLQSIRQVAHGESSLHPAVARKVLHELTHLSDQTIAPRPLTMREMEVLRLVAHGLSNQEIAERLSITDLTVRTHVSNMLGKLHLASRTQAALYALREGLASLDESELSS